MFGKIKIKFKNLTVLSTFIPLFLTSIVSAQSWFHYKWDSSSVIEQKVFDDANQFFRNTYKDNIYVGDMNVKTSDYLVAGFYYDYLYGNFYPKFNGYEAYIRNVLNVVVKDTNLTKNIKIYFYYDSDLNASMDALGNMRVNIGMFNYFNSEADLVALLTHEFGHFFNKDGLKKFNNPLNFLGLDILINSTVLKNQETAADYVAIKMIKDSPYSTKGISNMFKMFKRFEIKNELKIGNNMAGSYTHPDPGDRLRQVKLLTNDSTNIGKKLFVIDSVKFFKLKQLATQESFNLLVRNNSYRELIELSFTNYLYNPNDHQNLSVLLEGIRRYMLINPELKNKQFIIEYYKGNGAKKSDNYKFVDDDNTSILNYLNKGLLHLPSLNLSKIVDKDLLDSVNVRFTTYQEAFNYFNTKAIEKACKPCLISSAFKVDNTSIYNQSALDNNTVFECNSYLNHLKTPQSFTQDLYILNLPDMEGIEYFSFNSVQPYSDFLIKYLKDFKEQTGLQNVHYITEYNISDIRLLRSLNSLAIKLVNENLFHKTYRNNGSRKGSAKALNNNFFSKEITNNWGCYSPELLDAFINTKAKNIYFIDFDYLKLYYRNESYPGLNPSETYKIFRSWQFKKISFPETRNNIIYSHNFAETKTTVDDCLKECTRNFKYFLQKK